MVALLFGDLALTDAEAEVTPAPSKPTYNDRTDIAQPRHMIVVPLMNVRTIRANNRRVGVFCALCGGGMVIECLVY
jgi:hypothetical protein